MPVVTIPHEHFAKRVQNEYSDATVALWRELFQNSLDAGATEINIDVSDSEYNFKDNGRGMSYETMQRGLLTLGGSLKDEPTATGGYGIAKELLLFAHKRYSVRSNRVAVEGSVATYKKIPCEAIRGTIIWAEVDANHAFWNFRVRSLQAVSDLLKYSRLRKDLKVCLNGVYQSSNVFTEEPLNRKVPIGSLVAVHEQRPQAIVRVNGLVMFRQPNPQLPQTIILELDPAHSRTYLTSNRDGIKWNHNQEWQGILVAACIDRRSFNRKNDGELFIKGAARAHEVAAVPRRGWAEKLEELMTTPRSKTLIQTIVANAHRAVAKNSVYGDLLEKIEGGKISADDPAAKSILEPLKKAAELMTLIDTGRLSRDDGESELMRAMSEAAKERGEAADLKQLEVFAREVLSSPATGFAADSYIFNSTDPLEIEMVYGRSAAVVRLEKMWRAAVEAVVESNSYAIRQYRIGWQFDPDFEASYAKRNGVPVFAINPLLFLSLEGQWKEGLGPGKEVKLRLAVLAAHELCHQTQEYHDEDFVRLFHTTLENALHRLLGERLSTIRLGGEPRKAPLTIPSADEDPGEANLRIA